MWNMFLQNALKNYIILNIPSTNFPTIKSLKSRWFLEPQREATFLFLCSYVMTSHMLWHPTFYQWGVRNSCNLLCAFKGKEHALFLHISPSSWTEDFSDQLNLTSSLENLELWLRKSKYIKNPLYDHGPLSPVHAIEEREEINFLPFINFVCL